MTTVVSIKFKNRGKSYFFDPGTLEIHAGDKLIVETANGLEIADCVRMPHSVPDEAVVPPLRPVVRVATASDLRTAELNKIREQEALRICKQKVLDHKLDMKLIEAECNFEGNKTTFYFTSDGRVDFRDLVKDLAGIFRNRIELRQIGVRDEAKMLGGLGLCGRPYCCHQYMDDFKPVSTKMAKVQNLSLNPTKISGSCGRLMCCLRYEQEAYEDLVKHVPRQGAFVETIDGYGVATGVDLLRQTVKVRLDGDDDSIHLYKAREVAQVPGGRPKDGETPAKVLVYIPGPEDEMETEPDPAPQKSGWEVPAFEEATVPEVLTQKSIAVEDRDERQAKHSRNNRPSKHGQSAEGKKHGKPENENTGKKQPTMNSRKEVSEKRGDNEENRPEPGNTAGEYKAVKVEVRRSASSHHRRKPSSNGNTTAVSAQESGRPQGTKSRGEKAEKKEGEKPQNSGHHHIHRHRRGSKPGTKPSGQKPE